MFEVPDSAHDMGEVLKVERAKRRAGKENSFIALKANDHKLLKEIFPDIEIMGSGDESIVVGKEFERERVVSLGIDFRKREGVLPFAELYQLHKLASLLYPNYFPELYGARGFGYRDTERKWMNKNLYITYGDVRRGQLEGDRIESENQRAGIDFHLDPTEFNYAVDDKGRSMYIDIFDVGLEAVRNMDVEEVRKIFKKNNKTFDALEFKKRMMALEMCLRRISELQVVDKLYQEINVKGNYPDFEKVEEEVTEAVSGNEIFNERSTDNIMRVIKKAVDFETRTNAKYNNGWNF